RRTNPGMVETLLDIDPGLINIGNKHGTICGDQRLFNPLFSVRYSLRYIEEITDIYRILIKKQSLRSVDHNGHSLLYFRLLKGVKAWFSDGILQVTDLMKSLNADIGNLFAQVCTADEYPSCLSLL